MNSIAVIGGGASGMLAAISAARNGAFVTILEKNTRLGKKILSTGNGRCNLTNKNAETLNYHGNNRDFINEIKNSFWVHETLDLFSGLGLLTKEEDGGKIYPYSNQAGAVLDILRFEIERLSINIEYEFEAEKVIATKNGYKITSYKGNTVFANKVIIATGGKAAPDTGSNGGGYALAKMLGHSVTPLRPSLVQIKTQTDFTKSLKGIKTDAVVTIGSKSSFGELLFTEYGISGPSVFSVSSVLSETEANDVLIDLMPDYKSDDILKILKNKRTHNQSFEEFFVGILNKRVGMAIFKYLGFVPLSRKAEELSDSDLELLSNTIKNIKLKMEGTLSWNNAQVTSGGVDVSGINPQTLESLYNIGLYFTGEVLDIDGDCGGYNLQWAWSSGYIAGCSAANS